MDVLDFFRGALSADAILDYLDQLPRTSAYCCAIAQDEELAQHWANRPDPPPATPPLSEWGPDVAVLAELRDLVAALVAVTVKAHGGKPGTPKPYPRPVTALDRARTQSRYARHQALAARLLPR